MIESPFSNALEAIVRTFALVISKRKATGGFEQKMAIICHFYNKITLAVLL